MIVHDFLSTFIEVEERIRSAAFESGLPLLFSLLIFFGNEMFKILYFFISCQIFRKQFQMYLVLLRGVEYFKRLVKSVNRGRSLSALLYISEVVVNFDVGHIIDCIIKFHVLDLFLLALLNLLSVFIDSSDELVIALNQQIIARLELFTNTFQHFAAVNLLTKFDDILSEFSSSVLQFYLETLYFLLLGEMVAFDKLFLDFGVTRRH